MENIKYIELSYCDMPYMLHNQKGKKVKINGSLLELYNFGSYALIKVIEGINELPCNYYPTYRQQVFYEEKARVLYITSLNDEEKKQKTLEIINQFIKVVTK